MTDQLVVDRALLEEVRNELRRWVRENATEDSVRITVLILALEARLREGATEGLTPTSAQLDEQMRSTQFRNDRGALPGSGGKLVSERMHEQIADARFRPDRVIVPVEFMTERMRRAESLEEIAEALVDAVRPELTKGPLEESPESLVDAVRSGAAQAEKDIERLEGLYAIDALGGVVMGPTADQLDWLLGVYLREQAFTQRASRVTVLDAIVWLRKTRSVEEWRTAMKNEKPEQLVEKFEAAPDDAVKRIFAELRGVMAGIEADGRLLMMVASGIQGNAPHTTRRIVENVWRELQGPLLDHLWEFEDDGVTADGEVGH